ncbi:PREDICTED: cytochrome P450 714A1-like isoform X2 [Fragaria vesca subsp. vesca]|uniref:cytochrome P450 714A1-like isoform X2 n=1 Tax=Fragaria vesca subsp. vesca TaxID=101020 RepID=UPI0002C33BB7|nr:PREDICTED: cytochrome P450 714A1-like isoform X2 [Fragaria vesca subsp. vesca]
MEEGLKLAVLVCWSVFLLGVLSLLMRFLRQMWLKPARIRSVLSKQGIRGPRPSFLVGNVPEMQKIQSNITSMITLQKQPSDIDCQRVQHNWDSSVFPYLQQWAREYGPVFLYSTGAKQHLYVSDPKLLRELKLHNSLNLCRPTYLSKPLKPLLGNGLIVANGHEWAYQRKLIAPEFFLDKVKGMVGLMEESTMALLETWESLILESESGVAEIRMDQDLKTLSADIISRACFGSSYSQGNQIFAKIAFLQDALSKPNMLFGFLNFRFFRTETDKKIRSMNKEVDDMLLKLVNDRRAQSKLGGVEKKDLLEMILESAARDNSHNTDMPHYRHKTDRFILDNCRNIYFAGSETTALTVSWTLMLLSLHPEWQERIRAEIVEVGGDHELYHCLQDMDIVRKFKTLTMVILESLRLYGPGVIAAREALTNMKLGDLDVPEGIHMWVYHPALHRDTENWGADANEFKPERFANGVSESCKYPQAYMPFGFGTRLCIGQTFAMLQLKIVLSLILSKFSFSLSPNYRHSPVYKMLLLPEHGIRLIVRRV